MAGRRQVQGTKQNAFPPSDRGQWDFSEVADGHVYELRRGRDFEIEVESLASSARRWAKRHGYRLTTRTAVDEDDPERPKVALYVKFER